MNLRKIRKLARLYQRNLDPTYRRKVSTELSLHLGTKRGNSGYCRKLFNLEYKAKYGKRPPKVITMDEDNLGFPETILHEIGVPFTYVIGAHYFDTKTGKFYLKTGKGLTGWELQ